MAVVYLLHFQEPISPNHTSQHYIGFANDLENRLKFHRKGRSGVRFVEVAHERGICFVVARIWEDATKGWERTLKNRKNAPKLCPICRGEKAWKQAQKKPDTE